MIACHLCEKPQKNERTLKQHIRRSHQTPFSCDLCPYVSGQAGNLRRHTLSKHKNVIDQQAVLSSKSCQTEEVIILEPDFLIPNFEFSIGTSKTCVEQKIEEHFGKYSSFPNVDVDYFHSTILVEGLIFIDSHLEIVANPDREQKFTKGMQEIARGIFQVWVELSKEEDTLQKIVEALIVKGVNILRFRPHPEKEEMKTNFKHFATCPTLLATIDLVEALKKAKICHVKIVGFGMKIKLPIFVQLFGQMLPYCSSSDMRIDFGMEISIDDCNFVLFAGKHPAKTYKMCGTPKGSVKVPEFDNVYKFKIYPKLVHYLKMLSSLHINLARESSCSQRKAAYRLEIAKKMLSRLIDIKDERQYLTRIEIRSRTFKDIEPFIVSMEFFGFFGIEMLRLSKFDYILNVQRALFEASIARGSLKISATYKVLNSLGFSYASKGFRDISTVNEVVQGPGPGITNSMNFCFINSVLQSLAHLPIFSEFF